MSGKKFRFSLQRVLELRRHEAERAEQRLAQLRKACQAQEERAAEAHQCLIDLQQHAPRRGATGPRAFQQYHAHQAEARRAYQQAIEQLKALRQQETTARANLQAKRYAEEGLQKLKDQEKAAHQKKMDDAEAVFLDEQSVMRFRRSQASLDL